MKKTLTGVMMLLAGAYISHGQGAISMDDNYLSGPYTYVGYKAASGTTTLLGGSATGPAPTLQNYAAEVGNGQNWTVQLWGGSVGGTLSPLISGNAGGLGNTTVTATATLADGGVQSSSNPGTWTSSDSGIVSGVYGGQQASIQLYAWYNAGNTITSYAQAQADGVPTGSSVVETVTLGGKPTSGPSANPATLPSFGTFTVTSVPEPSTIALGVMGASALLFRLRRK